MASILSKIFNRKRATTFSSLSPAQRVAAARRIREHFGYAGYRVVSSTQDQRLRERGKTEYGGEDEALTFYQRTKMLNLVRNSVRNSSTLNAVLKQFEVNVVGTVGGKASFILPDKTISDKLLGAFARYARSLEYFDGMSFGEVLKKILITYLIGGDIVLLRDAVTGKIVAFEPDCINNLSEAEFKSTFPAGWTQRQGRIYNSASQFAGVICSHAQRGASEFKLTDSSGKRIAFVLLKNDVNGDPIDEDWVMIRSAYRFNQGRGNPPFGASLASVIDLEDVTKYEVQAAKLNSQTLAQIYQTQAEESAATLADGIDPTSPMIDWSKADDAAVEEAVAEARAEGDDFTFDEMKGAGVIINKMPAGAKMELLDTKHPNANMPAFIRWLEGRTAASLGIGALYATMHPEASYTQFRGEQVLSWPTFEELQKHLEQTVCDWVLAHFVRAWSAANRITLPENWERYVAWQWPRMREVNAVDEQTATQLKLKNCTGSYRDVYGASWRDRIAEIAEEIAECDRLGVPHPARQTVSGAVISAPENKGENE